MAAQRKRDRGTSKSPNIKMRIVFLQAAFGLAILLMAVRLYQIQITQHDFYAQKVLRRRKLEPAAAKGCRRRGSIYDCRGRELAVSIRVNSAFAEPARLYGEEPGKVRQACMVLQVDPEFLSPIALKQKLDAGQDFIWIRRKILPKMVEQLQELNISGIGFREETQRYYPARELCAQVLGFIGLDNHGLEGVELYYDQLLSEEKKSGSCSLILTIDKVIQYQTEKELLAACTATQARAGTAIVMEVKTGKILAMANWPQFNPNSFSKYPASFRRNRCLTDAFEPGSIFKIFLAACALESGKIAPNDLIYCENGLFHIGRRTIRDSHRHGWLTFSEVIKMSSNIGSAKVGLSLGKERLYNTLKELGFGSRTGIRLPGEAKGIIPPIEKWTELTTANISFGQGVLVTPLQIITAVCCLANDGWWREPKILDGLINERGEVVELPNPAPIREVASLATCRALTRMLEGVVIDGTGQAADIAGYRVAGKTGTAQKVDPLTRRYSQELFCSSFIGFFPAQAAQIAILVTIDEPKGEHLAGVVAAPVFRKIAQNIISYLNIPPVQKQPQPQDSILRLAEGKKGAAGGETVADGSREAVGKGGSSASSSGIAAGGKKGD